MASVPLVGEARSTHPSLGAVHVVFAWEMWAQSLDFHLTKELDHKQVPCDVGGGGKRKELPQLNAS